jgi:hypothetical protein
MFFILGTDGKEYGPVSVAKVQEWMIAGRANLQTQVRRYNETAWLTLGELPEFQSAGTPAPVAPQMLPVDSITAAPFAPASATPVVAGRPPGTPREIAATMIARSAGLDVFSCIARSFDLWKNNLLPLVGVTLLVMAIQLIIGFIPVVSLVNTFFLAGVFTGGLHYYYLGRIRGQPRDVGDVFAGFSQALGRLGLTTLMLTALMMAIMAPFFGPLFIALYKFALANQGATTIPVLPPMSLAMVALTCAGVIPLTYFAVAWAFSYTLVIDQGLGPWTALEVSRRVITKRWFSMLGLMICAAILTLLGLLVLIIGVIFALPLSLGALLYAYEDLCRPPPV